MRFGVWSISLALAGLGVACGDQPTEVVSEPADVAAVEMQPGAGAVAAATSTSEDGLSITTDKDDYAPGDTVWFTGAGWPANDTLDILLEDDPATHEPHAWWVLVSEDGTFRDSTYVVDVGDLGITFTLTATSRLTGRSLNVQFTDGEIQDATIEMRNAPGCATAQSTVTVGTPICAHAAFNIIGAGATPAQFRWKSPANVIVEIAQAPTFASGQTGSRTFDDTFTPNAVGTWTVLLCRSDNSNPAPGGAPQCQGNLTTQRASQTFTVVAAGPSKADQTISFDALVNKTYGEAPFQVEATATSGLDVTFALGAGSAGCSLSGATVTITAATPTGQFCIIVASQAGSDNYSAAPSVTRQLSIARANLSVAVDNKTRLYGQSNPTLTGTLTGVAYDDGITASYATTATQNSDVGTYPISATLVDPNGRLSNYNVPGILPQGELTITPAPLTVAAEDEEKDYDGQPFPQFTVGYTGFVLGQGPSVLGGTLGFTGTAVGAVNAGSYTITPGGLTSSNYAITFQNGALTINKVALTVSAVNREKVFDGLAYPFDTNRLTTTDVTYSGFVNNEGPSDLTGTLSFSAATATTVGTHTNTPSGLDAANYAISYGSGTLRILPWTLAGFYQPVDMSTGGLVWNTVKGGSTVPLKFRVFQATTADPAKERTDVGAVKSFTVTPCSCSSSPADAIEFTSTGGTSLRYDATDGQFVQNWQTPKLPGTCHRVTMTTLDDSKLEAFFKLK